MTHTDLNRAQRYRSVRIWRGAKSGSFQTYSVPIQAQQTVLDAVTYVQRNLDASLSYRFSCRVGMCGTCAMMVNGIPRWTCRTQTAKIHRNQKIEIAPLRNFPIIKDLVVDMDVFFDKWKTAAGACQPSSTNAVQFAQVRPQSPKRSAADRAIECIGCGVCYAACDVVSWKPDYLGPAALNRGWSLYNDVRYENPGRLLRNLATNLGCLSCHTTQSCTKFCPKGLDPSASIARLKSKSVRAPI